MSEAFGDGVGTHEVCERGVHPLLENVRSGGCSTCFMYGQTGSGKTFTMAGIEKYAASMLLPRDPTSAAADAARGDDAAVRTLAPAPS